MGALHQADSAALRSAASVWHDELAVLPKPLFVVNVGGPTSNKSSNWQFVIFCILLFELLLTFSFLN